MFDLSLNNIPYPLDSKFIWIFFALNKSLILFVNIIFLTGKIYEKENLKEFNNIIINKNKFYFLTFWDI